MLSNLEKKAWWPTIDDAIVYHSMATDEKYVRSYKAFEGDFRVIYQTKEGQEIRYTVVKGDNGGFRLEEM